MRTQFLDMFTHRAVRQVSRRRSLLSLGSAALTVTAMAQPEHAAGKKKGSSCQKKESQRCAKDAEACRLTVALNCVVPGGCEEGIRCCAECSATGFFDCAVASV